MNDKVIVTTFGVIDDLLKSPGFAIAFSNQRNAVSGSTPPDEYGAADGL